MSTPAHGMNARYVAGCRCDPCRWAAARYEKQRTLERARGVPRMVDSARARRQIEGLIALGWPTRWIAGQLTPGATMLPPLPPLIRRERATRIDELARRVGDRWGPSVRSRNYARRQGWRVPAWWDENWQAPPPAPPLPSPSQERRAQRIAQVRALTGYGLSAAQIAVRLGITQRQVVRDRQAARTGQAA